MADKDCLLTPQPSPRRVDLGSPRSPMWMAAALLLLVVSFAGCSRQNQLETGYTYRPLSSSVDERRTWYADDFSLEKMGTDSGSRQRGQLRRPSR